MRNSGVLLHISSLPSPYGIGTMGESARKFIDFLKRAGVRFWQMLPVGPTGYGDSPYQSFSSFAGNPYFIDLDTLIMGGWLTKEEADGVFWGSDPARADYGAIWAGRRKIFEKVYERFLRNVPGDFEEFCEDHTYWLDAYADFMALKDKFGGGREDFPAEYRVRGDIRDVEGAGFYKMQQYFFYKQWDALRRYAHEQGILLIGDLPIYASADSSDVWAFPEVFRLNGEYRPAEVAGRTTLRRTDSAGAIRFTIGTRCGTATMNGGTAAFAIRGRFLTVSASTISADLRVSSSLTPPRLPRGKDTGKKVPAARFSNGSKNGAASSTLSPRISA